MFAAKAAERFKMDFSIFDRPNSIHPVSLETLGQRPDYLLTRTSSSSFTAAAARVFFFYFTRKARPLKNMTLYDAKELQSKNFSKECCSYLMIKRSPITSDEILREIITDPYCGAAGWFIVICVCATIPVMLEDKQRCFMAVGCICNDEPFSLTQEEKLIKTARDGGTSYDNISKKERPSF